MKSTPSSARGPDPRSGTLMPSSTPQTIRPLTPQETAEIIDDEEAWDVCGCTINPLCCCGPCIRGMAAQYASLDRVTSELIRHEVLRCFVAGVLTGAGFGVRVWDVDAVIVGMPVYTLLFVLAYATALAIPAHLMNWLVFQVISTCCSVRALSSIAYHISSLDGPLGNVVWVIALWSTYHKVVPGFAPGEMTVSRACGTLLVYHIMRALQTLLLRSALSTVLQQNFRKKVETVIFQLRAILALTHPQPLKMRVAAIRRMSSSQRRAADIPFRDDPVLYGVAAAGAVESMDDYSPSSTDTSGQGGQSRLPFRDAVALLERSQFRVFDEDGDVVSIARIDVLRRVARQTFAKLRGMDPRFRQDTVTVDPGETPWTELETDIQRKLQEKARMNRIREAASASIFQGSATEVRDMLQSLGERIGGSAAASAAGTGVDDTSEDAVDEDKAPITVFPVPSVATPVEEDADAAYEGSPTLDFSPSLGSTVAADEVIGSGSLPASHSAHRATALSPIAESPSLEEASRQPEAAAQTSDPHASASSAPAAPAPVAVPVSLAPPSAAPKQETLPPAPPTGIRVDTVAAKADAPKEGAFVFTQSDSRFQGKRTPAVRVSDGISTKSRMTSRRMGSFESFMARRASMGRFGMPGAMPLLPTAADTEDQIDITYMYAQLGKEAAEAIFNVFDIGSTGYITVFELIRGFELIFSEWRNLRTSLRGQESVSTAIRAFSDGILFFVVFLIFLLIFEIDIVNIFVAIGAVLVPISFAFQGAISNAVGSVVFIVAHRPYDVGDWIGVNDCNVPGADFLQVNEVSLMTTTMTTISGRRIQMANYVLAGLPIENHSRSSHATFVMVFQVGIHITTAQFNELSRRILAYMKSKPLEWRTDLCVYCNTFDQREARCELELWATHMLPWSEIDRVYASQSSLVLVIMDILNSLDVGFRQPSLPVLFHSTLHAGVHANVTMDTDDTGSSPLRRSGVLAAATGISGIAEADTA